MKIVLVQSHIEWEDIDTNISKAEKIISRYKDHDLILFPEMSFTGFSMDTGAFAGKSGSIVGRMKDIAASYHVAVGFGYARYSSTGCNKCENVYAVITEDGRICSEYVKIHPFSYAGEDRYYTGGDRTVVFDLGGIPFSNFICYDLRFPEVFRAVADRVHCIIIPANWPAKRSEHWKTLLRARAVEDQVYILAVNCQGNIGGLYYSGDSCIIDPDGNVLGMLSDEEGEMCFEFTDDTEVFRERFPVLKDIKTLR